MKPPALFVAGVPASGKTTLGRAVASRIRAALLDLDTLTGPLTTLLGELTGANESPDHPWMRTHARPARYASLLATALNTLEIGTPAVLVAPFTAERSDPQAWEAAAGQVREVGAEPMLIWVDCPQELVLSRMRDRAAPRDSEKLAIPAKLLPASPQPPRSPHVRVDASRPIAEQLAELARHGLSEGNPACAEVTSHSTTWPPQRG